MQITKQQNGDSLIIAPAGRLDTTTAPQLESEEIAANVVNVVLDMTDVEYVSSAGLRVILSLHKKMKSRGKLIVKNINDTVIEVFNVTGFSNILNIE